MAFKDRLKMIRNGKDLSQAQLADALGVSPGAIGGYENGTRLPKDNILSKIAEYFGVSEEWLRRGALITDKQRMAIIDRFELPLEIAEPDADVLGIDTHEIWQALKSRAPLREDRVIEIASAIGTRIDDILADPALQDETEDAAKKIQELYDKHKGLFDILDSATPEDVEQIIRFADFVTKR